MCFPVQQRFFIALECNSIERVDFGRRDVKIANVIYGHSKGAAMGKFIHQFKGVKMDKSTEDVVIPVPLEIKKHYKNIHLDIDLLFVKKIPLLLAKSRYIGFIHCKALLTNHNK